MIHILDITSQMKADGIFVKSGPRTTGDGYYEPSKQSKSNIFFQCFTWNIFYCMYSKPPARPAVPFNLLAFHPRQTKNPSKKRGIFPLRKTFLYFYKSFPSVKESFRQPIPYMRRLLLMLKNTKKGLRLLRMILKRCHLKMDCWKKK